MTSHDLTRNQSIKIKSRIIGSVVDRLLNGSEPFTLLENNNNNNNYNNNNNNNDDLYSAVTQPRPKERALYTSSKTNGCYTTEEVLYKFLNTLLMAHPSKFYSSLKSFFFGRDWTGSASE